MLSILTRKDFLIGVAVGFLVLPYAAKAVTPLIGKVTGKGEA